MMSLLRFTILVIFCVVTYQNHDVNSQILYGGGSRQISAVEASTPIPPDPKIDEEGIQMLMTRLETLCVEKLEMLISDTNTRFQSLENQLSQCCSCSVSPVVQNIENLRTQVENLGKDIQVFIRDTNRHFQYLKNESSEVHSAVGNIVQNNENFEAKVENLGKNIQELMDATRNLPSDVEAIKRNVPSLINVTRSLVDLSSNSEMKQICNEIEEIEDLQTTTSTSYPFNVTLDKQYPKNCKEVRECDKTASGNYMIQPEWAPTPFEVVCDLETRGGGWVVIQRRFDGSQDFYLGWEDYKKGFGNFGGEFWLGLEHIYLLTGFEVNELLIELGNFESNNKTAIYSQFNIGSETEGYAIKVLGGYSGDAGDSFISIIGMKFTTKDNDQDVHETIQCAEFHGGAWWYHQCGFTNLNGKYFGRDQKPGNIVGIFWYYFDPNNPWYSLKHSRMLVRPRV